eukprot:TRINITY_DN2114_c0_g2_i1.p1 TRINITY_DN2114_c0_g2~~TRINITY_DN2114_c0_g2_i1.p1  ORF type:complete len:161 (-),score=39.38 TRINITY_DN2114_c0_g2_i1:95-577(-)
MLSMKQWYQRRVRGACEVNTLGYVMEALPQDLQENIQTFETKLQELENLLQPFFEVEMNERLSSMAPHDAARMNITIAYALNSLFYMYLKTQGISPADHPVSGELERIKEYIIKLKESQETSGPSVIVNTAASKRVIAHGISKKEKRGSTENPVAKKQKK